MLLMKSPKSFPPRDPSGFHRGARMIHLLSALASVAVVVATPNARFPAVKKSAAWPATHKNPPSDWNRHSLTSAFRGGASDPSTFDVPQSQPQEYFEQQQQQQQQRPQQYYEQQLQQQHEYPPENPIPPNMDEENVAFQETFQDRIDTWRNYQLQHAAEQRDSVSPRDEKGRMKLFVSISKASRSLTFFILMWRNVHLYEVVDQQCKGTMRFLGVLPLTLLFIANMAGVVASITSPGHASKKRLKAILNLDKLMELFLIILHVGKLLFTTSHLVPREIYISNIIHSVFFILQCQTVTRFVW
jgi:hypothetical protein